MGMYSYFMYVVGNATVSKDEALWKKAYVDCDEDVMPLSEFLSYWNGWKLYGYFSDLGFPSQLPDMFKALARSLHLNNHTEVIMNPGAYDDYGGGHVDPDKIKITCEPHEIITVWSFEDSIIFALKFVQCIWCKKFRNRCYIDDCRIHDYDEEVEAEQGEGEGNEEQDEDEAEEARMKAYGEALMNWVPRFDIKRNCAENWRGVWLCNSTDGPQEESQQNAIQRGQEEMHEKCKEALHNHLKFRNHFLMGTRCPESPISHLPQGVLEEIYSFATSIHTGSKKRKLQKACLGEEDQPHTLNPLFLYQLLQTAGYGPNDDRYI